MKTLLIAILAFLSFSAQAGGAALNTTISLLADISTGIYAVYTVATPTGQPSCATTNHAFAFDATTPGGKTMAAVALSALLSGKTVSIIGAGTCTEWSGLEDVIQINVGP